MLGEPIGPWLAVWSPGPLAAGRSLAREPGSLVISHRARDRQTRSSCRLLGVFPSWTHLSSTKLFKTQNNFSFGDNYSNRCLQTAGFYSQDSETIGSTCITRVQIMSQKIKRMNLDAQFLSEIQELIYFFPLV